MGKYLNLMYRKIGGLHFFTIGRINISVSVSRQLNHRFIDRA